MTGLIVHEWIARAGGSENVVEQFLRSFPDADLQVLWNDDPARFPKNTYETWIARTPLRNHKALALPFLPATWRNLKSRRNYEWILTSSHLFAHHARLRGPGRNVQKYSYVHTPARYIWEPDLDVRGESPLIRAVGSVFKPLDRRRAGESVQMAANSEYTRKRIQRVWDRDADVIYPPVNTEKIIAGADWSDRLTEDEYAILDSLPEVFILGASRFVQYKRLDVVIEAGSSVGIPVVLAGRGPEYESLKSQAEMTETPVHFVISPSDQLLFALYRRAFVFVFPAVEDFGIMPVEAMASGTPVIVAAEGGAVESIRLADGGVTIEEFDVDAWRQAFKELGKIDRVGLPVRASRFSAGAFRKRMQDWVPSIVDRNDSEEA